MLREHMPEFGRPWSGDALLEGLLSGQVHNVHLLGIFGLGIAIWPLSLGRNRTG